MFYIVKLWHSATVIKLLFRFSNLPPFSIFVSQHLLKGVIKNKSSSVINTLGNKGFFSPAARSIFGPRPTYPRPKTQAVEPLAPRVLGYTNVGRFPYTDVDSPTILVVSPTHLRSISYLKNCRNDRFLGTQLAKNASLLAPEDTHLPL